MKKILALVFFASLSLPAIADSTVPVVQFTIGFGEKVDVQEMHILGLRAGSDYAINAGEEEKLKLNKTGVFFTVAVAAAIVYAVALDADDRPTPSCEPPPGAVCY
jgi:hypothetical protein